MTVPTKVRTEFFDNDALVRVVERKTNRFRAGPLTTKLVASINVAGDVVINGVVYERMTIYAVLKNLEGSWWVTEVYLYRSDYKSPTTAAQDEARARAEAVVVLNEVFPDDPEGRAELWKSARIARLTDEHTEAQEIMSRWRSHTRQLQVALFGVHHDRDFRPGHAHGEDPTGSSKPSR